MGEKQKGVRLEEDQGRSVCWLDSAPIISKHLEQNNRILTAETVDLTDLTEMIKIIIVEKQQVEERSQGAGDDADCRM